ncbi:uncharacterized protein J7T54_006285 [Emericellopsis cladophorae]|uniref:Mitochondrial integral membrane protein n=1 Tax=Emericellopsis cladophorae TaxID=2686198 RepID=A0A9Q0BI76_9HYPO|nr:uncharacterized protein J7T54_006285 [Emericellopsis cladophorae]KAI6785946.1 hypothetical protein J7T54_006285 [Emericellopsis cladophorae]
MPLFSNNKRDDDETSSRSRRAHSDNVGEPSGPVDEHTRLLPNRLDSTQGTGMLRPDDPAVTPYNLWTIRILRFATVVLTLITFAWWVLLLVSAFATPPGFNMRGSGFYAFSFASLAMSNLLFKLIFFGVPAKAVRILCVVMAFILLLDMVLILSVEKTRYEEGWVGTASVVWSVLISLWTLLADRTVKWGKAEEEERLTGRAETRRTLTEWLEVLLSTIGYSIMTAVAVLITLTIILRALDAGVAPPGKLHWVDNGKYRIHVYCSGNSTNAQGHKVPTVLFEGGERSVEHDVWQFADNAIKNGSISRYCFADRPGIAWSDAAPSPLSASFATDVLSEALAKAGEDGPWVLASAGIGSIYQRVFSSRHGEEVKGMVLIDPLHEDLLPEVGSAGRGFLLWLRGVISPLGLDRLPGALFKGRTSRDRIYGRAAQQNGKFIFAKFQESLVAGSFTKRDVEGSRQIQHRDTPLVVISSGQHIKDSRRWEKKQRDLTKLTDNLKHWDIVDKASHEIWTTLEGRDKIEKRLKQLVQA